MSCFKLCATDCSTGAGTHNTNCFGKKHTALLKLTAMTEGNRHMSHNDLTTRSRKPGAFIQKVGGDNESQVQRIRTESGIYKRGKLDRRWQTERKADRNKPK